MILRACNMQKISDGGVQFSSVGWKNFALGLEDIGIYPIKIRPWCSSKDDFLNLSATVEAYCLHEHLKYLLLSYLKLNTNFLTLISVSYLLECWYILFLLKEKKTTGPWWNDLFMLGKEPDPLVYIKGSYPLCIVFILL